MGNVRGKKRGTLLFIGIGDVSLIWERVSEHSDLTLLCYYFVLQVEAWLEHINNPRCSVSVAYCLQSHEPELKTSRRMKWWKPRGLQVLCSLENIDLQSNRGRKGPTAKGAVKWSLCRLIFCHAVLLRAWHESRAWSLVLPWGVDC